MLSIVQALTLHLPFTPKLTSGLCENEAPGLNAWMCMKEHQLPCLVILTAPYPIIPWPCVLNPLPDNIPYPYSPPFYCDLVMLSWI